MDCKEHSLVGLIVRAGPYQQRSARSQLDVALVAAALEIPLRLYFLGPAVLQLLEKRELGHAQLAAGYRGWASLPEIIDVRTFAEPRWCERLQRDGLALVLKPEPMMQADMRQDWQVCDRVLVL